MTTMVGSLRQIISKMINNKKINIIYLYREVMPYNVAVFKELVKKNCIIHVVQDDYKKLTPYLPTEIKGVSYYKRSDFSKINWVLIAMNSICGKKTSTAPRWFLLPQQKSSLMRSITGRFQDVCVRSKIVAIGFPSWVLFTGFRVRIAS